MNVLVSGSTGLVGSAVVNALSAEGHRITRLVRTKIPPGTAAIAWDPAAKRLPAPALEGLDAVVHLAGENIAKGRWNAAKKAAIRDSRVQGTRVLCEALSQLVEPPKVLVSASAIGYYGSRGDRVMREDSHPGTDFLAQVCRDWEAATQPAAERGIRVVHLRIGVVMAREGGALHKMLTPFKLGGGGVMGSGDQYVSWVALDDLTAIVLHVLTNESLTGPVNAVAPHPVTNDELTKTLGRVLKRPTKAWMPTPVVKMLFGEMGDALLLSSTRVEPTRLQASGYTFRHAELEGALRHILGRAA
jgi:uncharacterized protein (TIGR01777 family)